MILNGLGLILSLRSCSDDDEMQPGTNNNGGSNSQTLTFLQSKIDNLGDVSSIMTAYTYDLSASAQLAQGTCNEQKTHLAQLT